MSQKKKQIREDFRQSVFKRDGFKCVFCNETQNLDAHHITNREAMPNGGYVMENGITVCKVHHLECEKFYMENEICNEKYIPEKLYCIIKSSKEMAVLASERLCKGV